ncbi:hypothetical protein ACVWXU_003423 [Streptomyces sp. TE33382]
MKLRETPMTQEVIQVSEFRPDARQRSEGRGDVA